MFKLPASTGRIHFFASILTFMLLFSTFFFYLYNFDRALSQRLIVVPDDFESIQAAIDWATEGDVIIVRKGLYQENLVVDKPLKVIGLGATIKGNGVSNVVEISTENLIFTGFSVLGSNVSPWAGIYVHYARDCYITNNTVMNNYVGIYLFDSTNITLSDNNLLRNRFNIEIWGLTLNHFLHRISMSNRIDGKKIYYFVNSEDVILGSFDDVGYIGIVNCTRVSINNISLSGNGEGILLAYSKNCVLDSVTLNSNKRGVRVIACNKVIIRNCHFTHNKWAGLTVDASSNIRIEDNLILKNFNGISFYYSSLLRRETVGNIVKGNLINGNEIGIYFFRSRMNIIDANFLFSNNVGLSMYFSHDNNISRNSFQQNKLALYLTNSHENLFFFNSFLENSYDVRVTSNCKNFWNLKYPLGGNYWSKLTLFDKYSGENQNAEGSDGIVDYPYIINDHNIDAFPQLSPVSSYVVKPSEKFSFLVDVFCNSYLWKILSYDYFNKSLFFKEPIPSNISFFKVIIPREVLYCHKPEDWRIEVNNLLFNATIHINRRLTCIVINLSGFGKVNFIKLTGLLIFKSVIYCDVNNDGEVNFVDVVLTCMSFRAFVGHTRWNPFADINSDGKVDFVDLVKVLMIALTSNS